MSGKKKKPVDAQEEVIALPPLRMVLVHAKDEVENKTSSVSNLRESAEFIEEQEGEVKPESVKKLIEHLERKKADK